MRCAARELRVQYGSLAVDLQGRLACQCAVDSGCSGGILAAPLEKGVLSAAEGVGKLDLLQRVAEEGVIVSKSCKSIWRLLLSTVASSIRFCRRVLRSCLLREWYCRRGHCLGIGFIKLRALRNKHTSFASTQSKQDALFQAANGHLTDAYIGILQNKHHRNHNNITTTAATTAPAAMGLLEKAAAFFKKVLGLGESFSIALTAATTAQSSANALSGSSVLTRTSVGSPSPPPPPAAAAAERAVSQYPAFCALLQLVVADAVTAFAFVPPFETDMLTRDSSTSSAATTTTAPLLL